MRYFNRAIINRNNIIQAQIDGIKMINLTRNNNQNIDDELLDEDEVEVESKLKENNLPKYEFFNY